MNQIDKQEFFSSAKYGNCMKINEWTKKNEMNVFATDSRAWTALHVAAKNGREKAVKLLITLGAKVEAKVICGYTALFLATMHERVEVVALLIEHGAKINRTDNGGGKTALHLAAIHECVEVAALLIEHGAKINATDNKGKTALHRAADYDVVKMVELLLKKGADPHKKDLKGKTAYDFAFQNKSYEGAKILKEAMKKG